LAVLIVHQLVLIALMLLIAQFLVGLFSWKRRLSNPIYQLLSGATRPLVWLVRRLTPRVVLDHHVPLVVFVLLVVAWVMLSAERVRLCRADPKAPGCERLVSSQR